VSDVEVYEVGGCVRDQLMGVRTKDVDYTVVADSYETMKSWIESHGLEIFLERPQYFTITARFPKAMTVFAGRDVKGLTGDFVLARKEGFYSDGRHPDSVEMGSLEDDLARRDFTVNAIAKDALGTLIDPFNGRRDIDNRELRCVGDPRERLSEDALRALRAVRFRVTKGFEWSQSLRAAMTSEWLPALMGSVSVERRSQELLRAFKHDTRLTMDILSHDLPPEFTDAVFTDGLWLMPTLKGSK
jgi:tRNA nucleotidyltransferase (CCA-adding enzyme)